MGKFGVPGNQLIAYVHYHPTFWYFHVHGVNCKHAMFQAEGSQIHPLSVMDRFHKLDVMIALLEAKSDYYETASLSILLQPEQAAWYDEYRVASARNDSQSSVIS